MQRIVFIIVYMGKYPWYFPYFLHSCQYNPTVDFLIFTDNNDLKIELSPNIRIIPCSIKDFNLRATKTLGFATVVESGYKLCDFKPAYGYIFSDLIMDYDFWGYCDVDIIFGNIRLFMSDELLNEYDVISARHDYLTGCFALYRNNAYFRELFRQSKDYREVFSKPCNFFFDETNFAFGVSEKKSYYNQNQIRVESMTHVVRRLQEEKKLRAYFEFQIVDGIAGNMLWNKGELIYRKQFEIMLYHLNRFKRKYSEPLDLYRTIPDEFWIGKKKIYYNTKRK